MMIRSARTEGAQRSGRPPALSLLVLLAAAFVAGPAFADGHEGSEVDVKYRQKLMSAVGANMGAISDIVKNQMALPGHVQNHASQLVRSADLVAAAFKKEVYTGATDAKAEIWKDWGEFEEAIAGFRKAAKGLEAAAASGDPGAVGPAVRTLGRSCGSCHKPFRKPKEESYKNR